MFAYDWSHPSWHPDQPAFHWLRTAAASFHYTVEWSPEGVRWRDPHHRPTDTLPPALERRLRAFWATHPGDADRLRHALLHAVQGRVVPVYMRPGRTDSAELYGLSGTLRVPLPRRITRPQRMAAYVESTDPFRVDWTHPRVAAWALAQACSEFRRGTWPTLQWYRTPGTATLLVAPPPVRLALLGHRKPVLATYRAWLGTGERVRVLTATDDPAAFLREAFGDYLARAPEPVPGYATIWWLPCAHPDRADAACRRWLPLVEQALGLSCLFVPAAPDPAAPERP